MDEGEGVGVGCHIIKQVVTLPTPIQTDRLAECLAGYDLKLTEYLTKGFREGFSMDFRGVIPGQCKNNLPSALEHPEVVTAKIDKELAAGRISGPFKTPPFHNLVTSPLGLVEKKTPGQFRLIHNLSHPHGGSINSGIFKDCSTVQYASVDDAIKMIPKLGRGCFLAKTDVRNAFRILPLRPIEYHMFGFVWNNLYFYDRALCMK